MEKGTHSLSTKELHAILKSVIAPRPIAWISTLGRDKVPNLAPFSFFNVVSPSPPLVMVSILRKDGIMKDTARNIVDTKEAVVHIVPKDFGKKMVLSSDEVEPHIDEFEISDCHKIPAHAVKPSRIEGVPVALEVTLHTHQVIGENIADMFLLEVVHVAIENEAFKNLPHVDALARLGGLLYCDTKTTFEVDSKRNPEEFNPSL